MNRKLLLLLGLSIFLLACQKQTATPPPQELPSMSDTLTTNDAAGGIALAGTPLPEDAPTAEYVKVAMATKYPAGDMDNIEIEVTQKTELYFSGLVKPVGQTTGGGYVYAAKDEVGDWVIVADGQGTTNCDAIEPYNFPTTMISECLDEDTGETIQR